MKSKGSFTPDDLTMPEIMARFSDDEKARAYLESIRWPSGPVCPHCGNKEKTIWKIESNKEKNVRAGLYQCSACDRQFTVTVRTIFEDSHIPLHKWLVAWYRFAASKKGISALQIQRELGIGSYRTAWFMMHRIRHAIATTGFDGPLGGTVEVDETYVGGKVRGKGRKAGRANKTPVVSLVERGGGKRSIIMPNVTAKNLRAAVLEHVQGGAHVHTDEHPGYQNLRNGFDHRTVNHSQGEYSRRLKDGKQVTTNSVESSFALLKRGIVGAFHHVSKEHLHRYCAEFDFRWNHRKDTDGRRTVEGLKQIIGKRLTYKATKKKAA